MFWDSAAINESWTCLCVPHAIRCHDVGRNLNHDVVVLADLRSQQESSAPTPPFALGFVKSRVPDSSWRSRLLPSLAIPVKHADPPASTGTRRQSSGITRSSINGPKKHSPKNQLPAILTLMRKATSDRDAHELKRKPQPSCGRGSLRRAGDAPITGTHYRQRLTSRTPGRLIGETQPLPSRCVARTREMKHG